MNETRRKFLSVYCEQLERLLGFPVRPVTGWAILKVTLKAVAASLISDLKQHRSGDTRGLLVIRGIGTFALRVNRQGAQHEGQRAKPRLRFSQSESFERELKRYLGASRTTPRKHR